VSGDQGDSVTGRLAAIVESSDDAIISKNLDGVISSWNKSAERLFGYTAEEAIGQSIMLIIPADRRKEEESILDRIRHGQRVDHFETVRRRKDGTLIELSVTISPVRDSTGRVVGASKVGRDITERRQSERALRESEERLRKTEKLAAAGQLAASLAHEINNPLSSVTNALYLLKTTGELSGGAKSLVDIASSELARMARIVKQSLSYYRRAVAPTDVDIATTVAESLQVFSAKLERVGIAVQPNLIKGYVVSGFADEIRQIIDNLLLNAIEAMPDGGRLRIEVRPSRDWKQGSRQGIRFVVADTGSGIPKNIASRIFEPFFTTKEEKGTGLGLWVVRGLVAKHEGRIRVCSSDRAGRSGTVISIFWPTVASSPEGDAVLRRELAV
jgi:PAS domain S-box-containing protein